MNWTRRGTIAALGACFGAAMALPTAAETVTSSRGWPFKKPPRLRAGDTIGLIEPATASDETFQLTLVEEAVAAMGLKPKRGASVLGRHGYLANTDEKRAADVNAMFADPDVRAILAVRGGWGSARLLPYLDWPLIRDNPKLLIGFSDITALHMAIAAQAGFVTIHGPNGGSAWGKGSLDHFKALAFDGATPTLVNPLAEEDRLVQRRWRTQPITQGKAQGRLLGGNLTVLTALAGTPYLPDFKGAILFLEDVDEAEYRIDRMLTQLGQAGVLGGLAGAVFGQCTNCVGSSSGNYGGFTLTDVLTHHLGRLGVPAYQGAWFGHIADQFSLPVGVMAEIDADAGTIRMLEAAVT
ncbi:MAG: LD-carboxypeptidase [Sphingopyxis sp.]|nr:LD-carboxypeptidase [Sphingopyxis sp.]